MTELNDVIRPLGAIENFFSAYAETGVMAFAMAMRFNRRIDEARLADVLAAIQAAHPLLAARIGLDPQGNLALLHCHQPISLTMRESGQIALEGEIAQALAAR